MKVTLKTRNLWYILSVRKEGYAGLTGWFMVKPTKRQVRKFIAKAKFYNKQFDRNRSSSIERSIQMLEKAINREGMSLKGKESVQEVIDKMVAIDKSVNSLDKEK